MDGSAIDVLIDLMRPRILDTQAGLALGYSDPVIKSSTMTLTR